MSLYLGSSKAGSLYHGSTKIGQAYIGSVKIYQSGDPYNPLGLPAYTIRLRYSDGVTPTFSKGTGVQVSVSPNIWDLTYENTVWRQLLNGHRQLLEILGANSTGVTNMANMLSGTSISTVPLFDTSATTSFNEMCANLNTLTRVPLFNVSSAVSVSNDGLEGNKIMRERIQKVLANCEQGLSTAEKAQARANIDAQASLTAGSNVQINNNVISATDTTYTAGTNISIDANKVISATMQVSSD